MTTMRKRAGVPLLRILVLCLGGIAVLWAHVCIRQGLLHQPSPGLLNFEGRECAHDEFPGSGCPGTSPLLPEDSMGPLSANVDLPKMAVPEFDCEQAKVVYARAKPRGMHIPPQHYASAPVVARSTMPRHQEMAGLLQAKVWGRKQPCSTAWLRALASVVVLRL